jgi:calcium-dependent protein kinase
LILSARYPFNGANRAAIFKEIKHKQVSFEGKTWEIISNECKDLISKMLQVNVKNRITAGNALKH